MYNLDLRCQQHTGKETLVNHVICPGELTPTFELSSAIQVYDVGVILFLYMQSCFDGNSVASGMGHFVQTNMDLGARVGLNIWVTGPSGPAL